MSVERVGAASKWWGRRRLSRVATNKEFARYLDISIKSANETEHHLLSARDHALISPDDWAHHTKETIEVRKMIFGYRSKVLEDSPD